MYTNSNPMKSPIFRRPPETRGGRLLGPGTRLPPPPLRAHLVTKGQWLLAIHRVAPKAPENFVPFAGDPRECRGDVAFPPSFGPQPSGAIDETWTIFESTLCFWVHHGDPRLRFRVLILFPLLGTPENAGVM